MYTVTPSAELPRPGHLYADARRNGPPLQLLRSGIYQESREISSTARKLINKLTFFFLKDPAPPDISPFPLPDPLPTPRFNPFRPARPTPPTCRAGQAVAPELRCTPPAPRGARLPSLAPDGNHGGRRDATRMDGRRSRSEEHTSELQSQSNLVCRLLLEK